MHEGQDCKSRVDSSRGVHSYDHVCACMCVDGSGLVCG